MFILACLMLPRNPQIYTLFCSLLTILFIYPVKIKTNQYSKLIIYLCEFIFLTSIIRFLTSFDLNLRDYLECLRYLPVILIFLSLKKWQHLKLENLIDAVFVYLLIDALVSYLQLNNLDLYGLRNAVKFIYNSDFHYQMSLGISKRTLGLSAGPGDHGAIIFVVFIIMICGVFLLKTRKTISSIGSVISLLVILSSQSRTVFVAMLLSILTVISFLLIKKSQANKFIVRGIWVAVGVLSVAFFGKINEFLENYRYLSSLFERGLEINSYMAREEKWALFISATQEKFYWLPIGWGKDFFGQSSGAMDSEYIYIYCVYGVLVFIIFVGLLIKFIFSTTVKLLLSSSLVNYKYNFILLVIMSGGIVISFSSNFLLDQRISYLLALITAAKYWEARLNLNSQKVLIENFKKVGSKIYIQT